MESDMPNLSEDGVPDMPVSAIPTDMQDAAHRIEAMLGAALDCDPAAVSAALRSEPVRAELQAVLAQLEPARLVPVLHRLATGDPSNRREVLEALLAPDPSGSGQVLHRTLQALHRQALLARLFHADRVQALRSACRPLIEERA